MTAINAVLKRDRAILMTDASLYDPDGTVVAFGMKAVAIPNLKAAIAVRGAQKVAALLAMEMACTYRDFDHLLERAPDDMPRFYDSVILHLADIGMQNIDVLIVGWSDQDRTAKGFAFTSQPEDGDDECEELDSWALAPWPSDDERENLQAIGARPEFNWTAESFDPIRHGIPIMEAQRRMRIVPGDPEAGAEPIHIVGGNILLTEVTADGITQRIVHRWEDDCPGEPIRPAAFSAAQPQTLSRQQRRALERSMKKERA
ncbi:MAG TPA: hypothetical protein VGN98_16095 [Tianweitania sediminis]|jgi:hypothetical protein|nr:hypothetical protein [Tianweitania sediminis]